MRSGTRSTAPWRWRWLAVAYLVLVLALAGSLLYYLWFLYRPEYGAVIGFVFMLFATVPTSVLTLPFADQLSNMQNALALTAAGLLQAAVLFALCHRADRRRARRLPT